MLGSTVLSGSPAPLEPRVSGVVRIPFNYGVQNTPATLAGALAFPLVGHVPRAPSRPLQVSARTSRLEHPTEPTYPNQWDLNGSTPPVAMDDRAVVPDDSLLKHIFANNQPSSVSIILQNWDQCIFSATLPNPLQNGRHSCVVRLEASNGQPRTFHLISATQEIAATFLPSLVPETLQVGTAVNDRGREFEYAVLEFVEGVTLEKAWDEMSAEDQRSVTAAVVDAVSKLQAVRLSDAKVQTILRREFGQDSEEQLGRAVMGGPTTGFLSDGRSLLSAIEQKWKLNAPFYSIGSISDPEGLIFKSDSEDLGSATVSNSDMAQWQQEAVSCHNDLSPRNLLLRCDETPSGETTYELAAIIDWELGGFYPPSYQVSLHDTYLGNGNQRLGFYLLLKEGLKDITPSSPAQIALLRAMELIFESRQRWLWQRNNIPAQIRVRFMEMLGLSRDEKPYLGWSRKSEGGAPPEFSRDDSQKLEDEVVAEMVARRQAKAKANARSVHREIFGWLAWDQLTRLD